MTSMRRLKAEVIDGDPRTLQAFVAMPRWQQIPTDVEGRLPRAWVAFDDDVAYWPDQFWENLVACEWEIDLRAKLVISFSAGAKTNST